MTIDQFSPTVELTSPFRSEKNPFDEALRSPDVQTPSSRFMFQERIQLLFKNAPAIMKVAWMRALKAFGSAFIARSGLTFALKLLGLLLKPPRLPRYVFA